MTDTIGGFLEVGRNDKDEIVVNHPDLKPDAMVVGHIVFSPDQARHLASLLVRHANTINDEQRERRERERMAAAAAIPVDRSATTLTDGSPVTPGHRELKPDGQQKGYVVLSAEERAKGFVRPVRHQYVHTVCGKPTYMGTALAETYARYPKFYSGTFCAPCSAHFPLDQFVWAVTTEVLGS